MLVLADRGFFSFELWAQYLTTGADLLWRVSAGIKLPVLEILPDGSYLSVINSKKTRSASYRIPLSAVEDPRDATHIPVRVIEYTVTGEGIAQAQTYRLITTILDPEAASALELACAYQQRWEYEISLKEIETQLLEPGQGGLCETQFEKVEGSDGVERCGVGACGSTVVGVHASPRFELGDRAFDHVANLVDRCVEFFLPVEEFSAGWLAIRGEDACSDVTFIADCVVITEKFA